MDEKRFKFRPFEESDFTRDNPVTVDAWEGIFAGFKEQLGEELFDFFYTGYRDTKFNEFRTSMTNNGKAGRAFTLIDTSDNSIAAMGSYTYRDGFGTICSNAVRGDLRGYGLGSGLHRKLLDSMRAEGIKYAQVGTGLDEAHASARRSYERAGFDRAVPNVVYFRKNSTAPAADGFELPDGIELRTPDESDCVRIAEIAVEAWQPIWAETRRLCGDELFAVMGDRAAEKYNAALADARNPAVFTYGLYVKGALAGFCNWRTASAPGGNFGQVGLNGISDAYKGHGYGLVMQNFIVCDMLERGIEYSKVMTGLDAGHAPARKTYERSGFKNCLPSVTYRTVL
nr:GNAT family N-acetyltransferase [Clostridia bacterium]